MRAKMFFGCDFYSLKKKKDEHSFHAKMYHLSRKSQYRAVNFDLERPDGILFTGSSYANPIFNVKS